jgi:hypothetical protein
MKTLPVVLPLLLLFCGCAVTQDRDVRAYNACLLRHPNETALCEAPRQAYQPDVPNFAASSSPGAAIGQ